MKEKTKGKYNNLKAGGCLTLLITGFVVAMMYLSSVNEPVVNTTVEIARGNCLVTSGPGDPGWDPNDPTQMVYIQIRPHVNNGTQYYSYNRTNATAYEYGIGNQSALGSTPFATAFDILVKVEISYADGYNQTTSVWDLNYSWITLTCADLAVVANTNMSEKAIANSGISKQWRHYWMNNSNAGYTIVLGQKFNITSIKYWVRRPV
jgi:hypothetical protein